MNKIFVALFILMPVMVATIARTEQNDPLCYFDIKSKTFQKVESGIYGDTFPMTWQRTPGSSAINEKENEASPEYEAMILKTKPIIIPLCGDCFCAMTLQRLKLRFLSYPFDWFIRSGGTIIDLIENDFSGFMEIQNLDIRPLEWQTSYQNVYNKKYKITLHHDFPEGMHSTDPQSDQKLIARFFPAVVKKYSRRIRRFYNALNQNKKIFFLWLPAPYSPPNIFPKLHSLKQHKIWLEQLTNLMEQKFPLLDFAIIYIGPQEVSAWRIKRCKIFGITQLTDSFVESCIEKAMTDG